MTSQEREADRLARKPVAAVQLPDGFFYVLMQGALEKEQLRVCEDCWSSIPRYVDFPQGLTSPESDGYPDIGFAFAKTRPTQVEGKPSIEPLRKAVCVPCYHAAMRRCYPGAVLTPLSEAVMPSSLTYVPPIEPEMIHIAGPRMD